MTNSDSAGELCCIVVDELHMVCDPQRGLSLELSLTKLLFLDKARCTQIVGMSATMAGRCVYAAVFLCLLPLNLVAKAPSSFC